MFLLLGLNLGVQQRPISLQSNETPDNNKVLHQLDDIRLVFPVLRQMHDECHRYHACD